MSNMSNELYNITKLLYSSTVTAEEKRALREI